MAKRPSIEELLERIDLLTARVELLERENSLIRQENIRVRKENIKINQENMLLREKLTKYENPRNSRNSSVPPSKDEHRPARTKSLREATGKKPGGQKGHEGNTLKMTSMPDKVVEHIPEYCSCCGEDIREVPCEMTGARQVIDIPPVKPKYTEHRIYSKRCSCGHLTETHFPPGVNTPVSYGSGVESLIGYLHSRQFIPFERMKEIFHDVFSLPISEGGLHHVLSRFTEKALPVYEAIRDRITKSKVVGTDETGMKVNGKKYWYWTWQNEKMTFIAASQNRGYATIEENFTNGFPASVMVHDCWKSHFQTQAHTHQLCLAHLLRELNYLSERYASRWPRQFKKLLCQGIAVKKQMHTGDYYRPYQPRSHIEDALNVMLGKRINPEHKELASFKKRMEKYRDYLLVFLHHSNVPPDNNGSERAIRNVKVKQKISGQFKALAGAKQFAVLRSITDTAIKNGQNVLGALRIIANVQPTD